MSQKKTGSPVQFELTKGTKDTAAAWIRMAHLHSADYISQSRVDSAQHISTRQYNRIFHGWIEKLGLDNSLYSTHSVRKTKPYLISTREQRVFV